MLNVRNLFDLAGKVALVTGGSRGLGLQMALALGGMGARVAITARKADELTEARAQLEAEGIEVLTVTNDLSNTDGIPALVDGVVKHFGTIDILVNNAGATWGAPAEDYPAEAWHKVMNLNVNAMFFLSQYVGKHVMIPKRSGKIINISSVAGLMASDPAVVRTVAYNATKHGVVGLTRQCAAEWGEHGITVNAICPGFFPSKMTRATLDTTGEMVRKMTPTRRLGGPEDLKGLAVLLASEASRHITGQAIAVDGGALLI